MSSSGWQHHQAAAEDRQEDGAGGGLEEDPGGPEGHGGFASASRRQGEHSSEGGEAHFLFAPQTAWQEKTSCSTKERHEKPLNAYKCHWRKREQICPFSGYRVANKQLMWGYVE